MELWHAWACPYCMRVRAALAEKGIPYRLREIDLAAKPPDLFVLNPAGAVPVLVDGPDVVVGSLAILEHLCKRWPEPPLFPKRIGRDAIVKAYERVDRLFAPHLPRIARGTPEERVEALGATRRAMSELDAEIPDEGFLLGELSVADLALASFVAKLPPDWRPTQLGLERLARWERAVMQRPTVREQMGPQPAMVA
jgi:RNA polymerase-associated protein